MNDAVYFCGTMMLMLVPELSLPFILFCAFCLTILILFWYYLYYFARVSFYKVPSPQSCPDSYRDGSQQPPVSVVICAKNEDHNLPEFLPIILTQDYPQYEVVVVNDCSWDNTPDVLREFEKKYAHLKVITIKEDVKHYHGKKFALMVGIKGTQHEHLLLTDADCRPMGNQWLTRMMSKFSKEKEIVLGYSKYEKLPGLLNKLIRFDTFTIALQYMSFAMAGSPYMGIGRNLAYKKSLFFKHKGFASHYHIESGDDDLFINEVSTEQNTAVEISDESFTVSRVKKDWKGWVEQKKRHLTTWKNYRPADKFRLAVYPFAIAFFWILFGVLMAIQYETYVVLSLLGFRIVVYLVLFKLAMDKLKEKDLLLTSLLSELFLLIFYPALTIFSSAGQNKKWKRI